MSTEIKTIHEFDFTLICEYFATMERQGPGSPDATLRALGFIERLTDTSRIADLGCGTGGQTMVLAAHAPGEITGLDLFPVFIELFNRNAALHNFGGRVKGITGSMDNLPFRHGELDLIWSEGAIYNIGFERGLREWNPFLKTGGYLAVTEASWFTPKRPAAIEKFWHEAYPQIDTIPRKVEQMQQAGYIPVATFILPEVCWTDNFYLLQRKAQEIFLKKHKGNPAAEELVANERREARLYARYKQYYGYVFYIGKKR